MREILADFWSNLFDKFGVFGLLIACAAPVVILFLAVVVVALIIAPFTRRKTRNDPVKVSQPEKAPQPEDLYKKAEDLAKMGWEKLPEAFRLYLQAANMGYFAAQYQVGRMYYYGEGTKQNKEEGLRWMRESAQQGGILARIKLAQIYDKYMPSEDPGEVLDWLIPIAEDGDVEAQYLLYRMYSMKQEQRKKAMGYAPGQWKEDPQCMQWYRQGKHWLEQAAKNGHEEAEYLYY